MKKKFKALTFGVKDEQGDIFMPGSINAKRVVLLDHFDNSKALAFVDIETTKDHLFFEYDPKDEQLLLNPAIGFTVIDSEKKDGIRTIKEANLYCVGLSQNQNIDTGIKPLGEQ